MFSLAFKGSMPAESQVEVLSLLIHNFRGAYKGIIKVYIKVGVPLMRKNRNERGTVNA